MEYRERCYKSYVSTHMKNISSLSKKEFEFLSKIYKKRFKGIIPEDKHSKILEIAFGAGRFLYFLQKEGYSRTMGVDKSQEQIQIAEKMGVKNVYRKDLFAFLASNKEKFDMIIANDIIEHLKKSEVLDFLDAIYNTLLPNGRVLISTINAQSLFSNRIIFIDFTHELGFTPQSISQVMKIANFKDIAVFGEKPVIHSFLWWWIKCLLRVYLLIEKGTGRGLWKQNYIF